MPDNCHWRPAQAPECLSSSLLLLLLLVACSCVQLCAVVCAWLGGLVVGRPKEPRQSSLLGRRLVLGRAPCAQMDRFWPPAAHCWPTKWTLFVTDSSFVAPCWNVGPALAGQLVVGPQSGPLPAGRLPLHKFPQTADCRSCCGRQDVTYRSAASPPPSWPNKQRRPIWIYNELAHFCGGSSSGFSSCARAARPRERAPHQIARLIRGPTSLALDAKS